MNIAKITIKTYISFLKNIPYLLKISWTWVLLIILSLYIAIYMSSGILGAVAGVILYAIISLLAFASIAVAWHQKLLTNDFPKNWIYLTVNRSVWIYLLYTIALFAMAALISTFLNHIYMALNLINTEHEIFKIRNTIVSPIYFFYGLGLLILLFILATYGLLLPARALKNNKLTGQKLEQITKGKILSIMVILLMASIPMIAIHEPNGTTINYIYGIKINKPPALDPSKVKIGKIKKTHRVDHSKIMLTFLKLFISIYFLSLLAALLQISALSQIYKELNIDKNSDLSETTQT